MGEEGLRLCGLVVEEDFRLRGLVVACSAIFLSFCNSSALSVGGLLWRLPCPVRRSVVPARISLRRLSTMLVSSSGTSVTAFAFCPFFLRASSAARFASSRLRRFSSRISRCRFSCTNNEQLLLHMVLYTSVSISILIFDSTKASFTACQH